MYVHTPKFKNILIFSTQSLYDDYIRRRTYKLTANIMSVTNNNKRRFQAEED
jgi:hypothetical protein